MHCLWGALGALSPLPSLGRHTFAHIPISAGIVPCTEQEAGCSLLVPVAGASSPEGPALLGCGD